MSKNVKKLGKVREINLIVVVVVVVVSILMPSAKQTIYTECKYGGLLGRRLGRVH